MSQPLLDETALLTCMAYVDLNPVRAGAAKTLEGASFTSIRARLAEAAAALDEQAQREAEASSSPEPRRRRRATPRAARDGAARGLRMRKRMVPEGLAPFADQVPKAQRRAERDPRRAEAIPMHFVDYLELLEATGRCARESGGSGVLGSKATTLLARLQLDPGQWVRTMASHGLTTRGVLGSTQRLREYARATGRSRVRRLGYARLAHAA